MLDSANVRVAVTGAVSVGATTATAPTDADTPLVGPPSEVQTVTIGGAPTGGTFTLTFKTKTTAGIAFDALGAAVQTALEALTSVGAGNVTVTGAAGGPYTVTFGGTLANTDVPQMSANAGGLTGGTSPTVTVATTTQGGEFADLGYVGEDGVTETRDRSTNTIKGWQNGDIVREVVTESSVTYHFVMVETKKETVGLYYGTTVAADGSLIIVPSRTGGRKSYVIDVVDGDDFIRTYIPEGEITEVGDQVYANGEAIGYEVTVRAYPSAALTDTDGKVGSAKKWYSSLAA